MGDITDIPIGYGEVMTVCSAHHFESCHKCCMLFDTMNEEARGRKEAKKKSKKPMKKGMLPKGTVVKTQMENRPDFHAVIAGWMLGDPNLGCEGHGDDLCYIMYRKGSSLDNDQFLEEIEDVHSTWQLVDMSFDQIRKMVRKTGFKTQIHIAEGHQESDEEFLARGLALSINSDGN